jgi:hypothetical protein
MFLNFINRLENIHFALLPNQLKPFIMEAVKIIVQNKYFKVLSGVVKIQTAALVLRHADLVGIYRFMICW